MALSKKDKEMLAKMYHSVCLHVLALTGLTKPGELSTMTITLSDEITKWIKEEPNLNKEAQK